MKKKILLLIVLSLFTLTGCNDVVNKEEKKETVKQEESRTFNWFNDAEKLPTKEIILNDANFKKDLKSCEEDYPSIKYFKDNVMYGECLNPWINNVIIETKGVFTYDIVTKKTNYYKYNNKKRIWNYVIKDEEIYYIEVSENRGDDTFAWELKKSSLTFTNPKTLAKGEVNGPDTLPVFIKSQENVDIYDVLINNKDSKDMQINSLNKIENDELECLMTMEGNRDKKVGEFLIFPNSTFKIKGNILTYSKFFNNKEIVYKMNLDTKETEEIYVNDEIDKWSLSEVLMTKEYYLLSYIGKENSIKGKMLIIDNSKNITLVNCNGSKKMGLIDNEIAIIELGDYYLGFSLKDKKFIYKYNISTNDYGLSLLDNNMLVVTNRKDNEIKYVSLK